MLPSGCSDWVLPGFIVSSPSHAAWPPATFATILCFFFTFCGMACEGVPGEKSRALRQLHLNCDLKPHLVLERHRKGAAQKLKIALRLRQQTTMTLAWIAQRLQDGNQNAPLASALLG